MSVIANAIFEYRNGSSLTTFCPLAVRVHWWIIWTFPVKT